jgi:hypothetical protein
MTVTGPIESCVQRQGTCTDHAGTEIVALAVDGGVVTTTATAGDGGFALEFLLGGTCGINASYPGYLSAYKSSVYVEGATVGIDPTTLVGGDVNADNCINILDVVSIIGDFGMVKLDASNPQDINDDGTVNILDLTIASGNFSRCGPTAWVPQ